VGDPVSVTCRGSFEVSIDADRAIELFTPEGERAWAEGWDPRYPDPDADLQAAGTAFTTRGAHGQLLWLITAAGDSAISYARFDPRGIVGAIEVGCAPVSGGATRVEVTYRLTAAHEAVRAELAEFARSYDDYLASWRLAIEATL
jgi:hypothetical protein